MWADKALQLSALRNTDYSLKDKYTTKTNIKRKILAAVFAWKSSIFFYEILQEQVSLIATPLRHVAVIPKQDVRRYTLL